MQQYICEICSKVFTKKHPKNAGRFCSRNCYYIFNKSSNPMKNCKQSKEAKLKISLTSIDNKYAKGYKHTESAKRKIKIFSTGRKHTKEYIDNMKLRVGDKNPFYNKKHSKSTKLKMSKDRIGKNNGMFGKHHTEQFKLEQSLRARKFLYKRLKAINKKFHPGYNLNACKHFEQFDKENNTKGKYATNGGEYYIKELSYWIDYINFDKKLIIEWDERKHFVNEQLKEKDVIRQQKIQKLFSDFEFKRIKE